MNVKKKKLCHIFTFLLFGLKNHYKDHRALPKEENVKKKKKKKMEDSKLANAYIWTSRAGQAQDYRISS